MQLFRENGFANVTILEICKAAGVTRNAFYYHFSDKEDLLCFYFADVIPSQNELFEQILSLSSDWEKLWCLLEAHLQLMEREGVGITRALMKASLDNRETIVKDYVLTNTWCVPLIQNCIQTGVIQTPLSAEEVNFLMTRMLLGVIVSWCNKDGGFELVPTFRKTLYDFLQPNLNRIN
ncbi:MAG: TetR/AcrR family transcriptional regulator [Eubacteriales bacterium]|nr:TetR/AcrR family transcriptional regulator [Eubacteriales bacterium]